MRRLLLSLALLTAMLLQNASPAIAVTEEEIEDAVSGLENAVTQSYSCGGLLNALDERALAYYAREKPPPNAKITGWCSRYDPVTGACTGKKCLSVGSASILQTCDASGTCNPQTPYSSCDFTYFQARLRYYTFDGGTAQCYSYAPNLQYARSYYPYAYNCLVMYTDSPVNPNDPLGKPTLIPPYALRPLPRQSDGVWEPTGGSSLATPTLPGAGFTEDSGVPLLDLDTAELQVMPDVLHPAMEVPTRIQDYPDLSAVIGQYLNPPEVRLVLPRGALSLGIDRSPLFERIFSSLKHDEPLPPVTVALGSNPDALTLAAEYLRSTPLLEVRYVPITIIVPDASPAMLKTAQAEWKGWMAQAKERADLTGNTFDAALEQRAEAVIDALDSALALHDTVQEYRNHFPRYLHELLSAVDLSNKSFNAWLEESVENLKGWHEAYTSYLPALRGDLTSLYASAAKVTSCLASACRLDAIPVTSSARPWKLFPGTPELLFTGAGRAYLPEQPRLYENYEGEVLQWHPPLTIGAPLPDLTLDFSEAFLRRTIDVPLLTVELRPFALPSPPAPLEGEDLAQSMKAVSAQIPIMPRFHPPLPFLPFPQIEQPSATDFLSIPPAPKALNVWQQAVQWKAQRIAALDNICDKSPQPRTFLVHEFFLRSGYTPVSWRAATLVPWHQDGVPTFPTPWSTWLNHWWFDEQPWWEGDRLGGIHVPPLVPALVCPECGTVRPQRFLRQHLQIEEEWQVLQDHFLRAVDAWNAAMRAIPSSAS